MVNYHGDGLLSIIENAAGTDFTLVKCLNTWGRDGEWKGDWSDGSSLWNEYPQIKEALNFETKNDGVFWIDINDFHEAFCLFWVASLKNEESNSKNEQLDSLDSVQPVKQDEYKSSKCSRAGFQFKIINDSDLDFKLFWIDWNGLEIEYAKIVRSESTNINSYKSHTWNLKNSDVCMIFTLGERLFEQDGCQIHVSEMMAEYL